MSIRTTVTLDEDVLERVKQESRSRGISFRETLNDLLRAGLLARNTQPKRSGFRLRATHMGLRQGLNYDNIESLLEYAEGVQHR
jgi:metal-responsive CopG/Arc/MetJ family transcriptional regulator